MTTAPDDDNPDKAAREEFNRRVADGTITAEEMMFDKIDTHKDKPAQPSPMPSNIAFERMVKAVNTELFWLVVYVSAGPKAGYFWRMIQHIEEKYFESSPDDPYAQADYFILGYHDPIHFILLKRSRITRKQIAAEVLAEAEEEERKWALEKVERQDAGIEEEERGQPYLSKYVIPWITGSQEDEQMIKTVSELFRTYSS
jgi:hypothetical protein